MTIIHFYPNFNNIGGAQSMVTSIYNGMKSNSVSVKICGFTPYNKIHSRYKQSIDKSEYIQFKLSNFKIFKTSILLSHHRKITTLLIIIKYIFFYNFKIIHIAHNEFFNLKLFSLYPKKIIAVSKRVKQNLIEEFNIKSNRITVIYNGIENYKLNQNIDFKITEPIKILYPARVNKVKKQIELVRNIQASNIKNIHITFCGDGVLLEELKNLTLNDDRFIVKGLVNNMEKEFLNSHFTMLYSEKEGLPVSLIESCNFGIPVICNDVGGNLEIVTDNYSGYVVNSYNELINLLSNIKNYTNYSILCKNSKNEFIKKFTDTNMIIKYLKFINEIR